MEGRDSGDFYEAGRNSVPINEKKEMERNGSLPGGREGRGVITGLT